MQEHAFDFLKESGLAKQILDSENGIKIRYNRIPIHNRILEKAKSKQYYTFVSDHLRAVISLCDESSTHNMVKMKSKYLIMGQDAVVKFRTGWEILEKEYL